MPIALVALASFAALLMLLGAPFQAAALVGASPFVVKGVFSAILVIGGGFALYTLSHPGRRAGGPLLLLAVLFALVFAAAGLELLAPASTFSGTTWQRCLLAMSVISPLAFAAAIYAARQLAPTSQHQAGLAAGLLGGGLAAGAYAPFCPETGALYLLVFYCLPILAMAAIGWLAGPRLLRW